MSIGSVRVEELIMRKYLSYSLMCLTLIISRGIQAKTTQVYIVGTDQVDYVQCDNSGWDSTNKNAEITTYDHVCKTISVIKGDQIATINVKLDCPSDLTAAAYQVSFRQAFIRRDPYLWHLWCGYPNNLIRTPFSLEGKSKMKK